MVKIIMMNFSESMASLLGYMPTSLHNTTLYEIVADNDKVIYTIVCVNQIIVIIILLLLSIIIKIIIMYMIIFIFLRFPFTTPSTWVEVLTLMETSRFKIIIILSIICFSHYSTHDQLWFTQFPVDLIFKILHSISPFQISNKIDDYNTVIISNYILTVCQNFCFFPAEDFDPYSEKQRGAAQGEEKKTII